MYVAEGLLSVDARAWLLWDDGEGSVLDFPRLGLWVVEFPSVEIVAVEEHDGVGGDDGMGIDDFGLRLPLLGLLGLFVRR